MWRPFILIKIKVLDKRQSIPLIFFEITHYNSDTHNARTLTLLWTHVRKPYLMHVFFYPLVGMDLLSTFILILACYYRGRSRFHHRWRLRVVRRVCTQLIFGVGLIRMFPLSCSPECYMWILLSASSILGLFFLIPFRFWITGPLPRDRDWIIWCNKCVYQPVFLSCPTNHR